MKKAQLGAAVKAGMRGAQAAYKAVKSGKGVSKAVSAGKKEYSRTRTAQEIYKQAPKGSPKMPKSIAPVSGKSMAKGAAAVAGAGAAGYGASKMMKSNATAKPKAATPVKATAPKPAPKPAPAKNKPMPSKKSPG